MLMQDQLLESRCGYVVLLMAGFWMTEAIPLPVTALIPVMLFPLLGIMSTNQTAMIYMKETNMMSVAGLIIAIAIEHCNLHKRIALKVLLTIGTSPRLLMLGFMLNTMFLSMWISNTATVAMMVPILQAVLSELKDSNLTVIRRNSVSRVTTRISNSSSGEEEVKQAVVVVDISSIKTIEERQIQVLERKFYRETLCYYLGVAYAANIGGTGVNFASWMLFNVPVMLVNVVLAWLWLQVMYMRLFTRCCTKTDTSQDEAMANKAAAVRRQISRRYAELGEVTWHEGSVLVLFITLVLLWFFRKPEFISGWANLLPAVVIQDSTPAMGIILAMFIIPANLKFLKFRLKDRKEITPALLSWDVVQTKLPWGLLFLLGGGFAMAEGSKVSGLSEWLGEQLVGLKVLPTWLVVLIICVMTTFATEVSSNTAVANILLPVLAQMARAIRTHPVYLMMPAALCCSYSFMLPIATPPNAIIADAAKMKTTDMMRAGLAMNILTILVLLVSFNTLGVYVFDLNTFPAWALGGAYGNATNS
ncbi:hypothetical protein B566_EDAN011241 [Ephemera danica]|nr:hypothetical protein B566_EDAN011241 [Ephemera danica]